MVAVQPCTRKFTLLTRAGRRLACTCVAQRRSAQGLAAIRQWLCSVRAHVVVRVVRKGCRIPWCQCRAWRRGATLIRAVLIATQHGRAHGAHHASLPDNPPCLCRLPRVFVQQPAHIARYFRFKRASPDAWNRFCTSLQRVEVQRDTLVFRQGERECACAMGETHHWWDCSVLHTGTLQSVCRPGLTTSHTVHARPNEPCSRSQLLRGA